MILASGHLPDNVMRLCLASLALLAVAMATPAHADDQSRLQTAREIVRLSHASDTLRALLPVIGKQLRPMLLQQSGNNATLVDQFLAKMDQRFTQSADGFVDLAAQVYAREFDEEDLNAYRDFYKSPAGQHMIEKQVVIATGMVAAGQRWGAQIAEDVLKQFRQEQGGAPSKL